MNIEVVTRSTLQDHPLSYRAHDPDQVVHIANSIKEHGFLRPVVIAEDGVILCGHGVVRAADWLGVVQIPVLRLALAHDDPRALKIVIGDNEVGRLARVNERLMTDLLMELRETIGLDGTTYDEAALSLAIQVSRPRSEVADANAAHALAGHAKVEQSEFKLSVSVERESDQREVLRLLSKPSPSKIPRTYGVWWPRRPHEENLLTLDIDGATPQLDVEHVASEDGEALPDAPPARQPAHDWWGLPSYNVVEPARKVIVSVATEAERDEVMGLLGIETIHKYHTKALSCWWPDRERQDLSAIRFDDSPIEIIPKEKRTGKGVWAGHRTRRLERGHMPRYPVYVISKGRPDPGQTARFLRADGVPFRLVIEPQEEEAYRKVWGRDQLEILPFSNLGQGSIPARNWCWEHALASGAERHWILDDNILCILRNYEGRRIPVTSGVAFAASEDFIDRYENIAVGGLNYRFFGPPGTPPYFTNVHVYSCMLIRNDLPHRWRGRYNEDTDLCLQVLGDGWCTVLINVFLADKIPTMTMKGGNADELYKGDGRLEMARTLERQWGSHVASVNHRFGRPQHVVRDSWRRFQEPLRFHDGFQIEDVRGVSDEYGMHLQPSQEEVQQSMLDLVERYERESQVGRQETLPVEAEILF